MGLNWSYAWRCYFQKSIILIFTPSWSRKHRYLMITCYDNLTFTYPPYLGFSSDLSVYEGLVSLAALMDTCDIFYMFVFI